MALAREEERGKERGVSVNNGLNEWGETSPSTPTTEVVKSRSVSAGELDCSHLPYLIEALTRHRPLSRSLNKYFVQ